MGTLERTSKELISVTNNGLETLFFTFLTSFIEFRVGFQLELEVMSFFPVKIGLFIWQDVKVELEEGHEDEGVSGQF